MIKKRPPSYHHHYDGAMGVGIPFDHPFWDPHRRHAARRRQEWDRMRGKFTDEELDETFDQDYGGGSWSKPDAKVAADQLNRKFKGVELAERKNNLIKEFEKFLDSTSTDVPGRDAIRDKIRDFKNDEKKHLLKDVTC